MIGTEPAPSRRVPERAALTPAPNVDADAGIIYNARLLGTWSTNKRRYPAHVLKRDASKYEGAKIFLDHPTGQNLNRTFRDWIGVVDKVVAKQDGLYGRLKLRRRHPDFAAVIDAARFHSREFGLSPVHAVSWEQDGTTKVAKKIIEVFSVDLVLDPATNLGLFESRGEHRSAAAARMERLQARIAAVEARNADLEHGQRLLTEHLERGAALRAARLGMTAAPASTGGDSGDALARHLAHTRALREARRNRR